jgi:hypothetical protein
LTENDGMLVLSVAGTVAGEGSLPDRTFLSYQFDPATSRFIIESRSITATGDPANSQNLFGDVLALSDTNFYFAFVDFANPLSPTTAVGGDFNGDGTLTAADIDLLSAAVRASSTDPAFDLNSDTRVNQEDRTVWVEALANTYFGDSNLDGEFSSADFVIVFQAGQYEDGNAANSQWATGDWNGDAEFDSSDFVSAFQAGGYEKGPRAAASAVPEPSSSVTLGWLVFVSCLWRIRLGKSLTERP